MSHGALLEAYGYVPTGILLGLGADRLLTVVESHFGPAGYVAGLAVIGAYASSMVVLGFRREHSTSKRAAA